MPDPVLPLSDEDLMRRVQAGDHAVFAELVRRYQPALTRVAASRLGRTDRAEDAVQESLLAAFQGRHTYRPPHNFRTWLWTILLNQCRRAWKRRMRRPRVSLWGDQPAETIEPAVYQASLDRGGPTPLATMLVQERAGLVDELLKRLTPV
ncbi:MAG TPA: RNA polymerase sigma factor, partial [Pirellulales bacterium]|nr:RNA polymerase sigma factor [Pirellulales bacterium]